MTMDYYVNSALRLRLFFDTPNHLAVALVMVWGVCLYLLSFVNAGKPEEKVAQTFLSVPRISKTGTDRNVRATLGGAKERGWLIMTRSEIARFSCLLVIIVALIISLSATYSRSGMVAFLVVACVLWGARDARHWIVMSLVVWAFCLVAMPEAGGRFADIEPLTDKSISHRFDVWRGTLGMSVEKPWTGFGARDFGKTLTQWHLPADGSDAGYATAVSTPLTVLGFWGYPALFVYLWGWVLLLIAGFRGLCNRNAGWNRAVGACFIIQLAFLVGGLFAYLHQSRILNAVLMASVCGTVILHMKEARAWRLFCQHLFSGESRRFGFNPNGVAPFSPRLATKEPTLGKEANLFPTPTGLWPIGRDDGGRNPVGVDGVCVTDDPQGSPRGLGQPWAGGRNPVGVLPSAMNTCLFRRWCVMAGAASAALCGLLAAAGFWFFAEGYELRGFPLDAHGGSTGQGWTLVSKKPNGNRLVWFIPNGGVREHAQQLCRPLAKQGWEVFMLEAGKGELIKAEDAFAFLHGRVAQTFLSVPNLTALNKHGTDRNVCATLKSGRADTDRNVCATFRCVVGGIGEDGLAALALASKLSREEAGACGAVVVNIESYWPFEELNPQNTIKGISGPIVLACEAGDAHTIKAAETLAGFGRSRGKQVVLLPLDALGERAVLSALRTSYFDKPF